VGRYAGVFKAQKKPADTRKRILQTRKGHLRDPKLPINQEAKIKSIKI
jgi:hypothetical protein